jgi:lambda repressor-like predicted transcriptional regulator
LTLVSKGFNRSQRIEKALAEAVGTAPEVLFPDRYQGKQP